MIGNRKALAVLLLVAVLFTLTACGTGSTSAVEKSPAQQYCEGLGHKYSVIMSYMGESKICALSLVKQCPAATFLAGACGEEFTYCAQLGGIIEPAEEGVIGNCVFSDGTVCNEFDLWQGNCAPPEG